MPGGAASLFLAYFEAKMPGGAALKNGIFGLKCRGGRHFTVHCSGGREEISNN